MAKPLEIARNGEKAPRLAPTPADATHVLAVAVDLAKKGIGGAMATVVARHGSAPSTPGQKLYVADDDTCVGTVGGGAVEREVIEALDAMLRGACGKDAPGRDQDARHEMRSFKLGAELGMCCGGSVDILLEPIDAQMPCLIVGGGHVATATAPLLARVGFAVTVCDAREIWGEEGRIENVTCVVGEYDDVGKDFPIAGACLVMTHDHGLDQDVIEWAMKKKFAYVGGVGSRAKAQRTRDRLEAKGFPESDRERLKMPIGMNIGARLPDEIAVSIAGEPRGLAKSAEQKMKGENVKTTLTNESAKESLEKLRTKNLQFMARYVGDSPKRQPVHTMYGGAHLFRSDVSPHVGALAMKALRENAPDARSFAAAVAMAPALAEKVYPRVVEKLGREPVEDFRIDFEDGYGNRKDEEEDGHAVTVAQALAKGMTDGTLPPFIGMRIKPLTEELRARSIRTLDIVLSELVNTAKKLPQNFVVTLPKVQIPEQVAALVSVLEVLEKGLNLPAKTIPFEIMIEQTQAIFDQDGHVVMPKLIDAAQGRCTGAHLGTYDYTASCNITAAHQHMLHPSCDFAKNVMQVSLGGSGIWLSDGATNVMPVQQKAGDSKTVHDAWKLHMQHTRHSLETGYYQGWDLHPAQLPSRFAAIYAFFLEALPAASERLKNFVDKAAQATLVGDVFDDAATGQGLLNFFLRGMSCGAISEQEALATGLTLEDFRGRSFVKILERRRG